MWKFKAYKFNAELSFPNLKILTPETLLQGE